MHIVRQPVYYFVWTGKDGVVNRLVVRGGTRTQAYESAKVAGWTKPKWWQLYRRFFSQNDYHFVE